MPPIHQAAGDPAPEAPAPVIIAAELRRGYVVKDDQLRKIFPPGAHLQQAPVHVLVLTREQPREGTRPQVLRVAPDPLQHAAADDRVAPFEDAWKVAGVEAR